MCASQDVQGLRKLLPAVGREVRSAQDKGGAIDMVVVVVGLNDFKHAYQSLAWGSLRRTAIGFKGELASFVEALHRETGVQVHFARTRTHARCMQAPPTRVLRFPP